MDPTAIAAIILLFSGAAVAQDATTQQMRDAQGTRIELHQDYRSDRSGTSSGVATRVQRSDGSGVIIGREQAVTAPPPPVAPAPPAVRHTTTTTTTQEITSGR